MKLSLCLAVFNEEKNIHYPLDSAYDLVDEVVIVDGGSTDRTVEIARSYGDKVKIISAKNPAMFHINKQKAIEAAKGEWIIQLDADEALSNELKKEIKDIIHCNFQFSNSNLQINPNKPILNEIENSLKIENCKLKIAYYIPRKNFFLTRFLMKGGQYPDYTIRLYRKGSVRFPCKDVHENVEIISKSKIQNPKSETIGYLKNPILHYADPDFSRYLMRWNRYTTLEVENMKKSYKLQATSYKKKVLMFLEYFFWKPKVTFFMMYFRHKGFMDGFPGFVFALFSSIRFWVIYIKYQSSKS